MWLRWTADSILFLEFAVSGAELDVLQDVDAFLLVGELQRIGSSCRSGNTASQTVHAVLEASDSGGDVALRGREQLVGNKVVI